MNVFGVLAALLTIFAAGFGVLQLCLYGPDRLHWAEQMAISWLAGTAIVSCSIWLFGFFARGELLFVLVALECLALPFVAWKIRRPFRFLSSRKLTLGECLLAGTLGVEILIVFYLSFVHTLGWDGLLNWEIKARYAFASGGALPPGYFQDVGRAFSHPEYPLGVPFTELWFYFWLGEANQFWAKTIFPIFYASCAILIVAISVRLTGKLWAALFTGIILFFLPQITVEPGSAIVGYADFPLSAFYAVALGYLLCASRGDRNDLFRIYAICLAALPWMKREGCVLWAVAAILGGFVIWRGKVARKYLAALLPGLCVALAWRIYLQRMQAVSSSDFLAVNFQALSANIHRLGPILSTFASAIIDPQAWGPFWLMVSLAAVCFARRFRSARAFILFTGIGAPIVIYAFTYVFSAWPDYQRHVELSITRLLIHVTPLALLALSAAFASLPSWQEVFCRATSPVLTDHSSCGERYPERTPGIELV